MILRAILALLAAACLAACATATPDAEGAKRIALTFDDVPRNAGAFLTEDERTTRLIDGLERAGVEQAAFFVTTGNLGQTTGGAERKGQESGRREGINVSEMVDIISLMAPPGHRFSGAPCSAGAV